MFDSSDEDMVQSAGCLSACGHAQAGINAGLTWRRFQMPLSYLLVNIETTSPCPTNYFLNENLLCAGYRQAVSLPISIVRCNSGFCDVHKIIKLPC